MTTEVYESRSPVLPELPRRRGASDNATRRDDEPPAPPVMSFAAGERVWVFYTTSPDDAYMPVEALPAAGRTPRIGMTHGWVAAHVLAPFSGPRARGDGDARVHVRYDHDRWADRVGDALAVERRPQDLECRCRPERVCPAELERHLRPGGGVFADGGGDDGYGTPFVPPAERALALLAPPKPRAPALSLLVVRWTVPDEAPAYSAGVGGWGPMGSAVSDGYAEDLSAGEQTAPRRRGSGGGPLTRPSSSSRHCLAGRRARQERAAGC